MSLKPRGPSPYFLAAGNPSLFMSTGKSRGSTEKGGAEMKMDPVHVSVLASGENRAGEDAEIGVSDVIACVRGALCVR